MYKYISTTWLLGFSCALIVSVSAHSSRGTIPHVLRQEPATAEGECSYCCSDACVRNWKIGFMAILFVEAVLFIGYPYLIRRFTGRNFSNLLHFSNAFSGGVFLTTGLLHVLPEAAELLSGESHEHGEEGAEPAEEEGEGEEVRFPLAYAMVLAGFYTLILFERVLLPRLGIRHSHVHGEKDSEEHENGLAYASGESNVADEKAPDSHLEQQHATRFLSAPFWRASMVMIGVSLHSFLESFVLGLSETFSTALNIFIAILVHRWTTAAGLGIKFYREGLSKIEFFILSVIFASVLPIAVGIGFALSGISSTVQGIFAGLAAGTFVYIGAFEVMSEEFVKSKYKPAYTFLATIAGAGLITIITGILTALDVHG